MRFPTSRITIDNDRFFYLLLLVLLLVAVPKSLGTLSADDYVHRTIIQGSETLYGSGVELARPDRSLGAVSSQLFNFVSDQENIQELKRKGILPWWADDQLKVSFWRPVSAATHWLDYQLWPGSPMAMKLHSVVWMLLLLVGLRQLFLALGLPNAAVNLALMIYAFDLSFMSVVNWIANRNAIIATAFGVYAVVSCLNWLQAGRLHSLVLSLCLFLVSLLSAEFGISTFGFIMAAVFFYGWASPRARWLTLGSFFLVIVAYRLAYESGNYGASFSGFYLDPLTEPVAFIQSVLVNLPVLVFCYFSGLDGTVNILSPYARMALAGFVTLILIALVIIVIRKQPCSREICFLVVGSLLALVPVCGVPLISGRVLLFFAVGGSVVMALLILRFAERIAAKTNQSLLIKGVMGYAVLVHLVLGPLAWSGGGMVKVLNGVTMDKQMYELPPARSKKGYLLLNQPVVLPYLYYPFYHDYRGSVAMRSVHVLAPSATDYAIRRRSANEIAIESPRGFEIFRKADGLPLVGFENVARVYDSMFRMASRPMEQGYQVLANGISYRVESVNAHGQPTEIVISFTDINNFQWVYWSRKRNEYLVIDPPGVGQTAMINRQYQLPES